MTCRTIYVENAAIAARSAASAKRSTRRRLLPPKNVPNSGGVLCKAAAVNPAKKSTVLIAWMALTRLHHGTQNQRPDAPTTPHGSHENPAKNKKGATSTAPKVAMAAVSGQLDCDR